MIKGNFFN